MTDYLEISNNYYPGYFEEGYDDDPYSSGTIAGTGDITTLVDGDLAERVLARTGEIGDVTITEHHWDMGYCVTCSSEVIDFLVSVDGEEVYRTPSWDGPYTNGDSPVGPEWLNTYAEFNAWLNGEED